MAQSGFTKTGGDTYVTSVRSDEYTYTWVINNFSVWLESVDGEQFSSKFPSGGQEQVKWVLSFLPESSADKEFCALFLELTSSPTDKLNALFEVTLTNGNGNFIVRKSMQKEFGVDQAWGWHDFILKRILVEKVKPKSDQLLIKCKIITNLTIVNETLINPVERWTSSLITDFKNLFGSSKFSDVSIVVAGQRFSAHKCILSTRSSVFNAMFEHQMQETIENCVSIDDVEPAVFKQLLRYIYTDELTGLETTAHDLYTAADKYDVATLKSLCRCHILEKLSWETGAETLILADLHGDLELKTYVLQFVTGSVVTKMTQTKGWKEMIRAYPHLVDEMINAMGANMTSSLPD